METMAPLVKRVGKDHALALSLWTTGFHEARILAALVDEPLRVTKRQMNDWVRDFDNWAVCDGVCFHLFDRTPFAWEKASQWAASPREFVKRAGFALMASLSAHDWTAADQRFLELLPLIEEGARDDRNFVKKAVNWALRQIGKRNLVLHPAAVSAAKRLAAAKDAPRRWVGKDALRELSSPSVRERLQSRAGPRRVLPAALLGARDGADARDREGGDVVGGLLDELRGRLEGEAESRRDRILQVGEGLGLDAPHAAEHPRVLLVALHDLGDEPERYSMRGRRPCSTSASKAGVGSFTSRVIRRWIPSLPGLRMRERKIPR